jgi:release factor glutamine methyltransferase
MAPGLEQNRADALPTVGTVVKELTDRFARAGIEYAAGDARRLVAGALGVSGADLLRAPERPLSAAQLEALRACADRRTRREPVSRILGEREFYGRAFAITPATLDPRPDSETLIDTVLELVEEEGWKGKPLRILDVGTGSGCLLLTLLAELPHATGLGTDISQGAITVAARNAARLELEPRVEWKVADGLESVEGHFHILIANPPYVRTAEIAGLAPEVRSFDPVEALDGGPDGLVMYRRLIPRIATRVPAGWIVFEVGDDQADTVAGLLKAGAATLDSVRIRIRHDVAGRRRCVAGRTLG